MPVLATFTYKKVGSNHAYNSQSLSGIDVLFSEYKWQFANVIPFLKIRWIPNNSLLCSSCLEGRDFPSRHNVAFLLTLGRILLNSTTAKLWLNCYFLLEMNLSSWVYAVVSEGIIWKLSSLEWRRRSCLDNGSLQVNVWSLTVSTVEVNPIDFMSAQNPLCLEVDLAVSQRLTCVQFPLSCPSPRRSQMFQNLAEKAQWETDLPEAGILLVQGWLCTWGAQDSPREGQAPPAVGLSPYWGALDLGGLSRPLPPPLPPAGGIFSRFQRSVCLRCFLTQI